MAMNFPNNPSVSDMFMVGSDMWSWNGLAWEVMPPSLESKASMFTNPAFTGVATGTFSGNLTGNVTGNVTGAVTGNASTATQLATARNINGVAFNGSANISVSTLVNGANTVSLGSDGTTTLPGGYLKIVPNGANPYISNRTDNGLGLVSGSAIQIRQSVADAYGITIDSSTTDTSLGGGGLLASGSSIDVNGSKIILGQYNVNNLDANTGLRVQNKIEINNSAILIGRYVSTLTSGTTTSAFSGITYNSQQDSITTTGSVTASAVTTTNAITVGTNVNISTLPTLPVHATNKKYVDARSVAMSIAMS